MARHEVEVPDTDPNRPEPTQPGGPQPTEPTNPADDPNEQR